MNFFSKNKFLFILAYSLIISTAAKADEYACYTIDFNQADVSILLGDTATCTGGGSINGVVNNHGELIFNQSSIFRLYGTINNHGLIKNEYELVVLSGANFINHQNAIFNSQEWLTLDQGSTFDNFGTINFIPNVGDGPRDNLFRLYGNFNNHNICLIDDPSIRASGLGDFINTGTFTISSRTDFSTGISYTQDGGETIVNGIFSTDSMRINAGTIRGTGTMTADQTIILGRGAGFSPGSSTSPLDTLTINVTDMLISVFNYVNIELGSSSQQHDKLHVNGTLYLFGTINITAQEIPSIGESFEIISSDSPITFGQNLKINLPNFLNWDVEYTESSIIIHRI